MVVKGIDRQAARTGRKRPRAYTKHGNTVDKFAHNSFCNGKDFPGSVQYYKFTNIPEARGVTPWRRILFSDPRGPVGLEVMLRALVTLAGTHLAGREIDVTAMLFLELAR